MWLPYGQIYEPLLQGVCAFNYKFPERYICLPKKVRERTDPKTGTWQRWDMESADDPAPSGERTDAKPWPFRPTPIPGEDAVKEEPRSKDKDDQPVKKGEDAGGTREGEHGPADLEKEQHKARDEHFGREQGGNQQGNQRGIGNPGDR